jgi:hypothetical protein
MKTQIFIFACLSFLAALFGVLLGDCFVNDDQIGIVFSLILMYWVATLAWDLIRRPKKPKKRMEDITGLEVLNRLHELKQLYRADTENATCIYEQARKTAQVEAVVNCIMISQKYLTS